jgi:hypothetical protein
MKKGRCPGAKRFIVPARFSQIRDHLAFRLRVLLVLLSPIANCNCLPIARGSSRSTFRLLGLIAVLGWKHDASSPGLGERTAIYGGALSFVG